MGKVEFTLVGPSGHQFQQYQLEDDGSLLVVLGLDKIVIYRNEDGHLLYKFELTPTEFSDLISPHAPIGS